MYRKFIYFIIKLSIFSLFMFVFNLGEKAEYHSSTSYIRLVSSIKMGWCFFLLGEITQRRLLLDKLTDNEFSLSTICRACIYIPVIWLDDFFVLSINRLPMFFSLDDSSIRRFFKQPDKIRYLFNRYNTIFLQPVDFL